MTVTEAPASEDADPTGPGGPGGRAEHSLHIALVHGNWPPVQTFGGIVRYLTCLADGLCDRGHSVTIVTAGPAPPATEQMQDGLRVVRVPAVDVDRSRVRAAAGPLLMSRRYAAALDQVDRIHPIDVVEFSNWAGEGLVHGLRKKRPHVTRAVTMGWQTRAVVGGASRRGLRALADRWRDWTEAAAVRHSDLVLAPSNEHGRAVAERLGLAASPVVVPLGTDVGIPVDRDPAPVVLFVGKMGPHKGFDTLVEAFARACPDLPEAVRMVVAGGDTTLGPGGSSYHDHVMRGLAGDVRARIEVLGWVTDEELAALYHSCLIVVAPSRYESFGLPAIEAMRYGKAVIASTAGGVPDVVRDCGEGLLVPPGQPDALARAITALISDHSLRVELERGARARYEREFTKDAFAKRTEVAYLRAITGYRRERGLAAPK